MLCREMSHSNTYGLTTMNAMLTSQIVAVTVSLYGFMNAMLTSQIVSLTVCSVQLMK